MRKEARPVEGETVTLVTETSEVEAVVEDVLSEQFTAYHGKTLAFRFYRDHGLTWMRSKPKRIRGRE